MKTSEYEVFERRHEPGRYVYAQVVGETPEGLAQGVARYREIYKFHECGMPFDQTSLTANLRRLKKM